MITIGEELFKNIPEGTVDLESYFALLPKSQFEDLLKICNRRSDDLSTLEIEFLLSISIALVFLELDIEELPEDSLDRFLNCFSLSVIKESLRRKGIITFLDKVSILKDCTAKITEKGVLVAKGLGKSV